MTEQNIKEGLEQELRLADYVDSSYCNNVPRVLIKNTLAYINNLQTEKEKLEYIKGCLNTTFEWGRHAAENYFKHADEIPEMKKKLVELVRSL